MSLRTASGPGEPISRRPARLLFGALLAGAAFAGLTGQAMAHLRKGGADQVTQAYGKFLALKSSTTQKGSLPRLTDGPAVKQLLDELWDPSVLGQGPYDAQDIQALSTITSLEGNVLSSYGDAKPSGSGPDAGYQNEIARGESLAIASISDTVEAVATRFQPTLAKGEVNAQTRGALNEVLNGATTSLVGAASALDGSMNADNTHRVADAMAKYAKVIAPHMPVAQRDKIIAAAVTQLVTGDARTQADLNQAIAALGGQACDALCAMGGQSGTAAASASQPATAGSAEEKSGSASGAAAAAPAAAPTIAIASIESVGSSIDDATLKAALGGDLAAHANELAHLNAQSIKIPELTITAPAGAGGAGPAPSVVYRDIELDHVKDGVAETVAIGGTTLSALPVGLTLGRVEASQFSVGALLGLYGMVPSTDQLRTVYKDFSLSGASLTTPSATCTIGQITAAELAARPLTASFANLMSTAGQWNAAGQPSLAAMAQLARFTADFTNAVHLSPVELGGLSCSFTDASGKPGSLAVGKTEIGAMSGTQYPSLTVNGMTIAMTDGEVSMDTLSLKPIDYSRAIQTLEAADPASGDGWLPAHARELVPEFAGLSVSGLRVDVPDTSQPGQRVQMSAGSFDLSLSDYRNGIPTQVRSSADQIAFDLPAQSSDAGIQTLTAAGVHQLNLGYDMAAQWDEASKTIKIDKLALKGAGLGSVALSAIIGNATADLFSNDLQAEQKAAMALTAQRLGLNLTDGGLGNLIVGQVARQQNQTPEAVRQKASGMAQATVLALLGGSPSVTKFANALGAFINGGGALSATLSSTAAKGLSLPDLLALQSDPSALGGALEVQSAAN